MFAPERFVFAYKYFDIQRCQRPPIETEHAVRKLGNACVAFAVFPLIFMECKMDIVIST